MSFDPLQLKQDFPILGRLVNGQALVYLDNAATTQKPVSVLDALDSYYTQHNANPHRAVHLLSEEATLLYEQSRRKVQDFINAPTAEQIVFTSGTTESINLVASTWGLANLKKGDQILLTQMEHHANLLPWQRLAQQTGAELVFIPVNSQGYLVDNWSDYIADRVKLVAFTHISNLLGTINPAKQIISAAHQVGAVTLVDAAQSLASSPLDVQDLDADFVVFSGHKMFGPTGIGVLYGKHDLLQAMPPYQLGGDMIKKVTFDSADWNDLPYKFEAGTPHVAGAIGLGAAIDYLDSFSIVAINKHLQSLTDYALEQLTSLPWVTIYGPTNSQHRSSLISFNLEDLHPHDVASILDQQGIAVRSGHHCAQPLTDLLGVSATIRASFALYNTTQDIDALVQGLKVAQLKLASVSSK